MSRRSGVVAGTAIGLALVLTLVWLTGLRGALHGVLLSAVAVAFLPFVIALAVLAVLLALSLIAVALGEDAGLSGVDPTVFSGTKKFARIYYRFVWRMRQYPLGWGLAIGLALGVLGVWAFLWISVVPREERTLALLLDAQQRVEAIRKNTGHFPASAADGLLTPGVLEGAARSSNDAPLLDAFGRPLHYRRDGNRFTAAYTLWSRGFDTDSPSDDICVSGSTALRKTLDELRSLTDLIGALRGGTSSAEDRASTLLERRCNR